MIVEREEPWGKIQYDAVRHKFSYEYNNEKESIPYVVKPILLNIDLTFNCNMNCIHCVAKDFGENRTDLVISEKLLNWIRESPFLVVVITGGEPLLPAYENKLKTLLRGINNKGLIIDTNGTIFPSQSVIQTIHDTNALVRISWDAVHLESETYFRRSNPKRWKIEENRAFFNKKRDMMERWQREGVNVAVQSVLTNKNLIAILAMPQALHQHSINRWYIQRFILSHDCIDKSYEISKSKYDEITNKLKRDCQEKNIECITKKDLRHNSVVLLVGDGLLYTQGQKPGQKILLGTIDSDIQYFNIISRADHAERYYEKNIV